jgi:2'-5' RNA ligase
VADGSALVGLHQAVERELFTAGFPKEARPFSPHLTLGRIRVDRSSARLGEAMAGAEFDATPFLVTNVTVMKSELTKAGAVYTPLARQPLKSFRDLPLKPE